MASSRRQLDLVMHGFEIAESIERQSAEVLTIAEGSLYPALQRMLVKGWLTAGVSGGMICDVCCTKAFLIIPQGAHCVGTQIRCAASGKRKPSG